MDQPKDPARKRISDLLNTLKVEPEAIRLTMEGKAVSRSETSLHLAGPTGLVAIPLDEIEDVVPLGTTNDPTMVSVTLRDATKVRRLSNVQPAMQSAMRPGMVAGRHVGGSRPVGGFGGGGVFDSDTWSFGWYIDSSTVTFGQLDMTDDVTDVQVVDDIRV